MCEICSKLTIGTLRPEDKNGNANGRETETSFLVAVFRFRRQNINQSINPRTINVNKLQNAKIKNSQRFSS